MHSYYYVVYTLILTFSNLLSYISLAMPMNYNGEYVSPMASVGFQQQTPVQNRNQTIEKATYKRPRSNISPPRQLPPDYIRLS
jgi:hypothetical protein